MSVKCSSCGANIAVHDENCIYCKTSNPGYRPVEEEVNFSLEKARKAYDGQQYAEAINHYKQAITLDPNVFDAYFYLASAYTMIKRYEEAIRAMEKANQLRPGSAPVNYNLGMLYKLNGRKEEACKYYELALAQFKKDPSTDKTMLTNIENELNALGKKKRWKFF